MTISKTSLKDFIQDIEHRTAMYIGGNTITHLNAFLDGWFFAMEEDIEDAHLLGEFQFWIEERFNIKGVQSWAKIILFYSNDEFDALQNFFDLFKDFLESKNSINKENI